MTYETKTLGSDDQLNRGHFEYLSSNPKEAAGGITGKAQGEEASGGTDADALTHIATGAEPLFTEVAQWPPLEQRPTSEVLDRAEIPDSADQEIPTE